MRVMRAAVRTESMNIRTLKTDKEDDVTVDDRSDSQLGLKAEVMKFN